MAISGQAGIGKSRLVWELEKYLDGLAGPQLYYWHQGRYAGLRRGRLLLGAGRDGPPPRPHCGRRGRIVDARKVARDASTQFVPDAEDRRWLEPALGALLGIEEANWAAREQLFSAWRTFFERIAESRSDGAGVRGSAVGRQRIAGLHRASARVVARAANAGRDPGPPGTAGTTAQLPDWVIGLSSRSTSSRSPTKRWTGTVARPRSWALPTLTTARRIVERAEGVPAVRGRDDPRPGRCRPPDAQRRRTTALDRTSLPALDIPPTPARTDRFAPGCAATPRIGRCIQRRGRARRDVLCATLWRRWPTSRADDSRGAPAGELAHKELVTLETDPRSPERGQYRFRQGLIREISYCHSVARGSAACGTWLRRATSSQLGRRRAGGRARHPLPRGVSRRARGRGRRRRGGSGPRGAARSRRPGAPAPLAPSRRAPTTSRPWP